MLRSVKFNTKRRLILFLLMVMAAVCLTAAACAEPIIQERAANDGSYVRWSIECENETRSVACNADDTCSMEITVLPWTTWKISANYFSVSEGELTGIIPVDGNCIWSGSNEKDFFVDDYGYVYVQGTSGSHEVVSHYVDPDGHAYTARITFHIENVSVTQSDAMRCVMLSRLAEDPYGCLSDYTSIDRYLSDMNIGINAGKSPLLKKGSTYQNGARLDHAIFASLNGGTIKKV